MMYNRGVKGVDLFVVYIDVKEKTYERLSRAHVTMNHSPSYVMKAVHET